MTPAKPKKLAPAKKARRTALKATNTASPGIPERCTCTPPVLSKSVSNLCTRCGHLR